MINFLGINLFLLIALASGCSSDNETFTLYRNSVTDENMRVHVATFDAADGETYNKDNCEQAKLLFQGQPDIKTKFWCEKGPFIK